MATEIPWGWPGPKLPADRAHATNLNWSERDPLRLVPTRWTTEGTFQSGDSLDHKQPQDGGKRGSDS